MKVFFLICFINFPGKIINKGYNKIALLDETRKELERNMSTDYAFYNFLNSRFDLQLKKKRTGL